MSKLQGKAAPCRSRGIASQVSKRLTGKPEAFRKVGRQSRERHRQFLVTLPRLPVSPSPRHRVPASPFLSVDACYTRPVFMTSLSSPENQG
jgi:hypothetical protein